MANSHDRRGGISAKGTCGPSTTLLHFRMSICHFPHFLTLCKFPRPFSAYSKSINAHMQIMADLLEPHVRVASQLDAPRLADMLTAVEKINAYTNELM